MEFNDLPKQKQLLIFMLNREASTDIPFTIANCGDEVVANGISASKNALANMLHTLRHKKQIEKVYFQNGTFGYSLSQAGQDEAEYWMAQCDNAEEVQKSIDNLFKTEEHYVDIDEAYVKRLEQIITGLKDELVKLTDQYNQSDALVKAQAKEIERLKAALKDVETENDSLRFSKKITRDAAVCLEEERTALQNERDSFQKSFYDIDERCKALAKENNDLTAKVAIIKLSLSSALADIDMKNKKIEHLEDSIDKLKHNLTKMAEWAGQMKNGSN